MSGDTPFHVLMQQAVHLKSQEVDSKRRRFLSWPEHLQHSLFHADAETAALRGRALEDRVAAAEVQKEQGNTFLEQDSPWEAVHAYESALGLFRWVESRDPDWQKSGIRDEHLVLRADDAGPPEVVARARDLQGALLTNLALARIRLKQTRLALEACDCALQIDPGNVKALIRRAKVRCRPCFRDCEPRGGAARSRGKRTCIARVARTVSPPLTCGTRALAAGALGAGVSGRDGTG